MAEPFPAQRKLGELQLAFLRVLVAKDLDLKFK
jgi:hypothetical protein